PLIELHSALRLSLPAPLSGGEGTLMFGATSSPSAIGSPAMRDSYPDDAIAAELAHSQRALALAQADVLAAWQTARVEPVKRGPREAVEQTTISVETHPALLDHTFYRQPAGWTTVSDRYPVVPM